MQIFFCCWSYSALLGKVQEKHFTFYEASLSLGKSSFPLLLRIFNIPILCNHLEQRKKWYCSVAGSTNEVSEISIQYSTWKHAKPTVHTDVYASDLNHSFPGEFINGDNSKCPVWQAWFCSAKWPLLKAWLSCQMHETLQPCSIICICFSLANIKLANYWQVHSTILKLKYKNGVSLSMTVMSKTHKTYNQLCLINVRVWYDQGWRVSHICCGTHFQP